MGRKRTPGFIKRGGIWHIDNASAGGEFVRALTRLASKKQNASSETCGGAPASKSLW